MTATDAARSFSEALNRVASGEVIEVTRSGAAIPITDPVTRVHAGIWAQLAEAGNVIGAHDLWIAATAIAHGLSIATRNQTDFQRVPGLRVITIP